MTETHKALIVVALIAAGWICIALITRWYDRRHPSVHQAVFANLNHAWENAHFEAGGYLHGWSAADIAEDLTLNAGDCEHLDPAAVAPYVRDWLYMKGLSQ